MTDSAENTPLLGQARESLSQLLPNQPKRNRKAIFRRYRLDTWIPIVLLTTFLVTTVAVFFSHVQPILGDSVAQGTTFESDEIKFLGVDEDGGINLQVKGTNVNNFTNIDDTLSRWYFKAGGFFLRQLNLKVDSLDVIAVDETKGDYKNLGTMEISPFHVKIVDGKESELSLFLTVFPKSGGVLGIIKRILLSPGSKLRLKGDAQVKVLIFNGFIPVSNLMIPLDVDLPTSLIQTISSDEISFGNFRISDKPGDSGLKCQFNVVVNQNPIANLQKLINYPSIDIPALDWNVIIDDCDDKPTIKLADLQSSNFEIAGVDANNHHSHDMNISLTVDLDSISDKLTEKCTLNSEDPSTPLSLFIDTLRNRDFAHFIIKGDRVDAGYPSLLNNIFQNIQFPVDLPVNTSSLAQKYVHNVTVENLSFELKDSATPVINGDLQIFVSLGGQDIDIEKLSVDDIKGSADMSFEGTKFGNLTLVDWNKATTTKLVDGDSGDVYFYVQSRLKDVYLDITDMAQFQKIVSEIFSGSGSVLVDIDALVDLMLKSPFGEFEIDGISVKGSSEFSL